MNKRNQQRSREREVVYEELSQMKKQKEDSIERGMLCASMSEAQISLKLFHFTSEKQ